MAGVPPSARIGVISPVQGGPQHLERLSVFAVVQRRHVPAEILSRNAVDHGLLYTNRGRVAVIGPATAAAVEAAGHVVELGPGDWVLIPAGTPHRVLQTAPGTQWIAVHDQAGEPLSVRP